MNPLLLLDVVRFELSRSWTPGRSAIWVVLVAFPIGLVGLLRMIVREDNAQAFGVILYFLVPEVICLLGLLLWASPVVSTELEGQTWIYLAMRPSGRWLVPFGKYISAVVWCTTAGIVSATVCVILMGAMGGFRLWWVMCALSALSCFAHASLYLLIGSIFFRRSMVAAVFYTIVFEYGVAAIPAFANKLTINYRLRGLLIDWMEWEEAREAAALIFGMEPASTHLMALAVMTALLLGVALLRISRGEYPTQQDG